MINLRTTRRRRRGSVAAAGTAAALVALAGAGTASATPYATGWNCISPFANFANSSYPGEEPAPSGVLDSVLPTLGLSQPASLAAKQGQPLQLNNLRLGLEFKDPRPGQQLYRRTGGLSVSYRGIPASQTLGDDTVRTLTARPNPTDANNDWWSYTSGATTTYVEPVATPWAPPSARGGGYIAPAAALGHQYVWHTGENRFPIDAWVAVRGTNTTQGVQVVHAQGYWTVIVDDATPGSPADPTGYADGGDTVVIPPASLDLSSTTWTPTGAGPVEFKLAEPGNLGIVQVRSQGYDRPGYNRPLNIRPFGNVFFRAETMSYGASNDCVPGSITVANSAIAASVWGDASPDGGDPAIGDARTPGFYLNNQGEPTVAKGARGRWGVTFAAQPAFAVAPLATEPVTTPKKVIFDGGSSSLALKRTATSKVRIRVTNPNGATTSYRVSIKSALRYKIGKTRKTFTVVVARTLKVPGGASRNVHLTLGKQARTLLKSGRTIRVAVTVAPVGGAKSAAVTLKGTLAR